MQTFKQYLSEGRGKVVSAENFIAWADANCPKYIAGSQHLYRGFMRGGGGILIGSSAGAAPRRSASGIPNNYTLWIDNHPSFKEFPKRSASFIASTSMQKASDFGPPYLMFVRDDDKVADVQDTDIWVKKVLGRMILMELNELTEGALRRYSIGHNDTYPDLQSSLRQVTLKRLQEWHDDKPNIAEHDEWALDLVLEKMRAEKWHDLWDVWDGLVTPKLFHITTGANIDLGESSEAWVQGECGFVSLSPSQIFSADRVAIMAWLKEKNKELFRTLTYYWDRNANF